ncbi:MAG TPA: tRNA 2-thiouridine(34) synthase MnmA [Candidatus Hydrogenedentes bacterium]|nr:tRNA 2-thiouridine(34) synthase MnmA [Candidatus Hydrogenedentota bacterium]
MSDTVNAELFIRSSGSDASPPGRDAVAVMMSGGVDSSVAALALREAGREVFGITMRIPRLAEGGGRRPCCGVDAAFVCRDLGIAHYFMEVEEAFERWIIGPFRQAYLRGETPSPCVDCNARVKFEWAWDAIRDAFGVRDLATGHYAQIVERDGAHCLVRGVDRSRDQSYFLYGVHREMIPFLHLPIGGMTKSEVRKIAVAHGLSTSRKPDSMELCFANEGDYRTLFAETTARSGPIVDLEGHVLGEHTGLHHYTVGQRRGLGIAHSEPLYVLQIRTDTNTVVVGPRAAAFVCEVSAESLNCLQPCRLDAGNRLFGKIRSVGEPEPCTIVRCGGGRLDVRFESPVFAPAAGQHLVLYDEHSAVVAGGVIRLFP